MARRGKARPVSQIHSMAPANAPATPSSQGARESRKDELLQMFRRGVEFTEELLQENERLRFRLVQLEEENRQLARQAVSPVSYVELIDRMRSVENERNQLLDRFRAVEEENRDFVQRYQEIEEENNRLANLYVASFALHSTLDLKRVIDHCFEILVNLVGTRDLALYLRVGRRLLPARAEGRELGRLPPIWPGRGVTGRAAQRRLVYLGAPPARGSVVLHPRVCIPLVLSDELLGMFVIYSFLVQKPSVTELDQELFRLLAGHAAVALQAAWLGAAPAGSQRWDGKAVWSRLVQEAKP
ncbi:MAG: GAF domain-containing protein [Myxococcales bacterium]|nr:GAF domain-containing protein [Myxococcales bacterium]